MNDILNILAEPIYQAVADDLSVNGENDFVRDAYAYDMSTLEILNWYRNLYYKEGIETERGLMAMTINDLFTKYKIELR